jgi:hypothetical protein
MRFIGACMAELQKEKTQQGYKQIPSEYETHMKAKGKTEIRLLDKDSSISLLSSCQKK